MSNFIKFVVGTALGLVVAVLVAFNALLVWVATGPRSLDRISPYIAAAFQPGDQSYRVKIGQTWLIWDGWKHPIDIRLRDITVLTKEGQVFSTFPEISVGLDVLSLARMRVLPTSLTITHPVISLFENDDRSINFGFEKNSPAVNEEGAVTSANTVPFAAVIAPLLAPDGSGSLRKLHFVNILDADVSVGSFKKGVFFKASHTDIIFKRNRQDVAQADISAHISYGNYKSTVSAQFTMAADSPAIEGNLSFSPLMPSVLAALFSDNPLLPAVHFPISGSAKLLLGKDGMLQQLGFSVNGGKGSIETDKLELPLPINTLHAEGELDNHAGDIRIDKLTADLGGVILAADGVVSLKNGDTAVRGNVTLSNATAANVRLLWPPSLSPESRKWIVENITEGKVSEATARVNIAFGDLAKPVLPKEDIDATITLAGAKIRYLPEHPEATNVKGVVHVNAVSLQADIQSAEYMKDTRLSNGKLLIEDLNADDPYIKLSFDATASAKDAVRFLGLPRLQHAKKLNLSEDSVEGSLKGTASLGFHFIAPRDAKGNVDESDLTFDVTADVKAITQPGFMRKFDIKNADGNFTVNNKGLEFKGTGEVNGANMSSSDIRYLFKPETEFDTFINLSAVVPVTSLPRFGYPQFPFLKGMLGVKASVKQGDTAEAYEASFDLVNASVTLVDFGWSKPDKEPASFDITAEKKDGTISIPSFHLKGKDMVAHGSGELDKDFAAISRVDMDKLRYGNNDLGHVMYALIEGGYSIEAKGKSADLTSWLGDKDGNSFSFEHFPAMKLDVDVGHVILGKNRVLSEVKGSASCDIHRCDDANIAGKTSDGKPFAFRILRNPKGIRQLSLHAQSAGAFLKAISVVGGMEGGDLTVTGNYDDNSVDSILKGRLDINEHTIKDAPILAKILSLASLTGFFDTMRGNGISFSRLIVPFTLTKDVITIDKAKTHGDAIGMTAQGTITFPKKILDIQGTIVPSYTVNSLLGKVPLVGPILTGGDGQGVFAARYSVKGSTDNPDVSVNPLSILTPGFLRGLFDIMDVPSKKESE